MTERIRNLRKLFIEEHQHRTFRKAPGDPFLLAAAFREQNLPDTERAVKRLVYMLDEETPLLFPEQTIPVSYTHLRPLEFRYPAAYLSAALFLISVTYSESSLYLSLIHI